MSMLSESRMRRSRAAASSAAEAVMDGDEHRQQLFFYNTTVVNTQRYCRTKLADYWSALKEKPGTGSVSSEQRQPGTVA